MTDLQFRSYLRQLVRRMEHALDAGSEEEMRERVRALVEDLKGDIG